MRTPPSSSQRQRLSRPWLAAWFILTSQSSPALGRQLPGVWLAVTASSPAPFDRLVLDCDATAAGSDSTRFNVRLSSLRKHDEGESDTNSDAATASAAVGTLIWRTCNCNFNCKCKQLSSQNAATAATAAAATASSANGSRTVVVRDTNQTPKRQQNGMPSSRASLFGLKGGATEAHGGKKRKQLETEEAKPAAQRNTVWPEGPSIFKRCVQKAGRGGLPGAAAGVLQVVTLMWLRTVVNYQCRYGASMAAAARELYRQGGILRFYRGVSFALISNPLSRFGMAAANEGALALSDALPRPVSVTFTTWIASLFAGVWRIVLTPLDTCKTVLQVEGSKGFALLMKKVWSGNVGCLYQGAIAASAATAVGYFPWFLVFNYLNVRLKMPGATSAKLLRNAGIGLAASITSDLCTNSIRVLKTTKQAAAAYDKEVTYRAAAALVIEADGWGGLLGRGLSTRILANGLQSMLFTVVWRYLHEKYVAPRHSKREDTLATGNGPQGPRGERSRLSLNA